MKIRFTDIHWRNNDDSDVFNMHAIQSVELDTDKSIITIVCATNTYISPYYGLTYGGGVTHFEFTCMHPYRFGEYIEIAIFEATNSVCVAHHCGEVPDYFKNKCKNFCI